MLHIEKYAADCLTFSNAGESRNLKKYFFHRLLYIKGHCLRAVPFSVFIGCRIVKLCSIENDGCIGYNDKRNFSDWKRADVMNFIYIVQCSDGTLYTGWTNDLDKRMKAHNEGRGAKYTRARRPVELVYSEIFETKEEALRREYAIKRMTRAQKIKLIEG